MLRQAMHHGCEAGPAELRSVCLAGKTGTADQKIPTDGGDRLLGPWHEGEFDLLSYCRGSLTYQCFKTRSGIHIIFFFSFSLKLVYFKLGKGL